MADIEASVDAKLEELAQVPVGSGTGRRLELGGIEADEYHQLLRKGLLDMAERVSPGILDLLPAVALEQLVVMSVCKDHDTAGLLKSLINSFVLAYITPETHDRAFNHLEGLEGLRSELAGARRAIQH